MRVNLENSGNVVSKFTVIQKSRSVPNIKADRKISGIEQTLIFKAN